MLFVVNDTEKNPTNIFVQIGPINLLRESMKKKLNCDLFMLITLKWTKELMKNWGIINN